MNCDYIIKGDTEDEILKIGAEHAIQVHGMLIGFLSICYAKLFKLEDH